ncbi:MAG: hypothetical protein K6T83_04015 [Alicyclobacillus sp.]|nr:hypothetical protein [Alicyclobacillus sp.]
MLGRNSSSVSESIIEQTKAYFAALQSEPKNRKRDMKALGCIFHAVATIGIHPILVGGQAVELYTFGNYASVDFDLVLTGREQFGEFLEAVGFEKAAGERHWIHRGLELAIEVPDSTLAGSTDKVTDVQIDEFTIRVIGVEDLILDRLRAGVYWKSTSDTEWAKFLIKSYTGDIDVSYIKEVAAKEDAALYEAVLSLLP